MGCMIAYAASHRQLYLASADADRRHLGPNERTRTVYRKSCTWSQGSLQFPRLEKKKTTPQGVPSSTAMADLPSLVFLFLLDPGAKFASFRNPHVNMIQKNLRLGTLGCPCLPQVMQSKLEETEHEIRRFPIKLHSLDASSGFAH